MHASGPSAGHSHAISNPGNASVNGRESSYVKINDGTADVADAHKKVATLRGNGANRLVAIADVLVCAAVWLAGAATYDGEAGKDYYKDSVINYSFSTSLFDVMLFAIVRGFLVDTLQSRPEQLSAKRLKFLWVIIVSSLVFGVVKISLLDWAASPGVTWLSACFMVTFFLFGIGEAVGARGASKRIDQLKYYQAVIDASPALDKSFKGTATGLGRVLALARPHLGMLSFAMVALLVNTFSSLALPFVVGQVVDALIAPEDGDAMGELNKYISILLVLFAIGAVSGTARSWLFTLAGHRIVYRLRADVFDSIVKQEISFFDKSRTGELTSRLSSDTQVLQNTATVNMSMLIRYVIQIIGSIVILVLLSWQLSLIMFATVPVIAIAAVIYGRYMHGLQKTFQDQLAAATTVAEEGTPPFVLLCL